jgi:hypothetical protein
MRATNKVVLNMRKCISLVLLTLLSTSGFSESNPQATPRKSANQAPTVQQVDAPQVAGFGIEDGTPIKLRIARTVSSADATVGETVDFEVLEEVKVGTTLVVPKAGIAWGTVTAAQSKRRMGRGGKLSMNIDSVRLVNGQKVALRAVKDMKGGGHVGAMTGAIVATSIVFFPAAPFFLFMHGKDITIPKGTEITAYINGNTPLDEAQFSHALGTPMPTNSVGTHSNIVYIPSNSAGADKSGIDSFRLGGSGIDTGTGFQLTAVDPNGPVAQAGLRPGDTINSIYGASVRTLDEINAKIVNMKPGSSVQVGYIRRYWQVQGKLVLR